MNDPSLQPSSILSSVCLWFLPFVSTPTLWCSCQLPPLLCRLLNCRLSPGTSEWLIRCCRNSEINLAHPNPPTHNVRLPTHTHTSLHPALLGPFFFNHICFIFYSSTLWFTWGPFFLQKQNKTGFIILALSYWHASEKKDNLYISRWTEFSEVSELKQAIQIFLIFSIKTLQTFFFQTCDITAWELEAIFPSKPVLTVRCLPITKVRVVVEFFWPRKLFCIRQATKMNVLNLEINVINPLKSPNLISYFALRSFKQVVIIFWKRKQCL